MARKNSLEKPKPRKKPREEPGYKGWPVLFWLCQMEIITEHGLDVQMFIDDQQGQIIIITVVVEGATGQHLRSKYTREPERELENTKHPTRSISDRRVLEMDRKHLKKNLRHILPQ